MKIDMEIYKLLLDLKALFKSKQFEIKEIEELGLDFFLDFLREEDMKVADYFSYILKSGEKIKQLRPNSKVAYFASRFACYSSTKEMKEDLFYLPRVDHHKDVFNRTKQTISYIYQREKNIFHDIMEKNGLITVTDYLEKKYGKNENQTK